jgi:sarcosine oxidase subunit beta
VSNEVPSSADLVIVGGGVIGMALALELNRSGRDVVILDRGRLGAASTSLNAGGVRHQFYQDSNILAAKRTVAQLQRWQDEDGVDLGYRQVGYLLMYQSEGQRARLAEGVERQTALGVRTRFVDIDEIGELAPDIQTEGILGACFGPEDGYFDPPSLAARLRSLVLDSGVRVYEDTTVNGVQTGGDRITLLHTTGGAIAPGTVVNAAGAWAPALARNWGETLPIIPRRSQVFVFEDAPALAPRTPHSFDCEARFYLRAHGAEIWSGAAFKPILDQAPPSGRLEADWAEAAELARRVGERVPVLAGRSFDRAWAGVIEVTADDNPVIGPAAADNVYTAAGFSGHGMCVGIGLASSIAAELNDQAPEIPLDIYRIDRFAGDGPSRTEGLWLRERPSRIEEWLAPMPDASAVATPGR